MQTTVDNTITKINPSNPIRQDYGDSDDSNSDDIAVNSISAGSDGKKRSLYVDLFCIVCQNKPVKQICKECKLIYYCAKSKKCYEEKKLKKSTETIDPNNLSDLTDQTKQVQPNMPNQIDPIRSDYSDIGCIPIASKSPKAYIPKTISNKASIF